MGVYKQMLLKAGFVFLFALGTAAQTACAGGNIVINEVCTGGSQQLTDEDGATGDWIELYNTSEATVSLADYYLSDDLSQYKKWQFPAVSIAAGQYLVVFATSKDRKPATGNIHTNFSISAGEPVILTQLDDGIVDQVTTDETYNCPADNTIGRYPNGSGAFTYYTQGGPGLPNGVPGSPQATVIINEVMSSNSSALEFPQGSGEYPDWIELYNFGNSAINLQGYKIVKGIAPDTNAWTFTQSFTIASKGHVIVYCNSADIQNPPQTDYNISSSGVALTLLDNLGNVLTQVTVPALVADESYGRFPDGNQNFIIMHIPTPGAVNQNDAFPLNTDAVLIKVNEVCTSNKVALCDSQGDFGDWIELYNTSSSVTVNMKNLVIGDGSNKWQFPNNDNIMIPPLGYLIVWADSKNMIIAPGGGLYEAHTNYNISSAGSPIILYNTDWGTVVDTMVVPGIPRDSTYGRVPDGLSALREMPNPTPSGANVWQAISPNAAADNIVINEVVTNNLTGLTDRDGDHVGWVELYNKGSVVVDMSGLRLTNGISVWAFPSGTVLRAGQYAIVFISGKNNTGSEFATNFIIDKASGGTLMLCNKNNPTFSIIDTAAVPALAPDVAWGKQPDGAGTFHTISTPTPGASNSAERSEALFEAADIDGSGKAELIIDFGPVYGIWARDTSGAWLPVHSAAAQLIKKARLGVSAFDQLVIDFGQHGIWIYDFNAWEPLHPYTAVSVTAVDMDGDTKDELVVDFGVPYGICVYSTVTGWSLLHSITAKTITRAPGLYAGNEDALIIDFGALYGIWVYGRGSWGLLHNLTAKSISTGDINGDHKADIIVDFGSPYGIWLYSNSAWSQLHSVSANFIEAGDINGDTKDDLIIDFGALYGIWVYDSGSWYQLHNGSSKGIIAVDVDGNGVKDVVIDFGQLYGIWAYSLNAGWSLVHGVSSCYS